MPLTGSGASESAASAELPVGAASEQPDPSAERIVEIDEVHCCPFHMLGLQVPVSVSSQSVPVNSYLARQC